MDKFYVWKMFLHMSYSLYLFQSYPNVFIIHWNYCCTDSFKNININLKIITEWKNVIFLGLNGAKIIMVALLGKSNLTNKTYKI
jgi:hypothetical protein